eukprot:s723_g2.t4
MLVRKELSIQRCRDWCYSVLSCQYWQYSKNDGCWVDAPALSTKKGKDPTNVVDYPLIANSVTTGTPEAQSVIAGEYIAHYCPPQVVQNQLAQPVVAGNGHFYSQQSGSGPSPAVIGVALLLVLGVLGAVGYYFMNHSKRTVSHKMPRVSTPRVGTPRSVTPRSGTPRLRTPRSGTQRLGTPRLGTPRLGTPRLGTPQGAEPGSADAGLFSSRQEPVEEDPPEDWPEPTQESRPSTAPMDDWTRRTMLRLREAALNDSVGTLLGKTAQTLRAASSMESTMRSTHTWEIATTPRDLLHIANNRRRDVMTEFQQVLRVQEPMLRKLRWRSIRVTVPASLSDYEDDSDVSGMKMAPYEQSYPPGVPPSPPRQQGGYPGQGYNPGYHHGQAPTMNFQSPPLLNQGAPYGSQGAPGAPFGHQPYPGHNQRLM